MTIRRISLGPSPGDLPLLRRISLGDLPLLRRISLGDLPSLRRISLRLSLGDLPILRRISLGLSPGDLPILRRISLGLSPGDLPILRRISQVTPHPLTLFTSTRVTVYLLGQLSGSRLNVPSPGSKRLCPSGTSRLSQRNIILHCIIAIIDSELFIVK